MAKLIMRRSEIEASGRRLARAADDLRSALGSLSPLLAGAVDGCGADPAAMAMAEFADALTGLIMSLAGGLEDVGLVSGLAAELYAATDAAAMGSGG